MLFQQLVGVATISQTLPAAVSPHCYIIAYIILSCMSASKVQIHAKFFSWIFYECICDLVIMRHIL